MVLLVLARNCEESIVRNSATGSMRSGWRTSGQVAVAAGSNWAAASCGHEKRLGRLGRWLEIGPKEN
jgi:hypothetical protein